MTTAIEPMTNPPEPEKVLCECLGGAADGVEFSTWPSKLETWVPLPGSVPLEFIGPYRYRGRTARGYFTRLYEYEPA